MGNDEVGGHITQVVTNGGVNNMSCNNNQRENESIKPECGSERLIRVFVNTLPCEKKRE